MTVTSVRLNARPDRSMMMATISQSMMVTWSIALFEHLDAMLNNREEAVTGSEVISYSETAWKLCDTGFPQIVEAAIEQFDTLWMGTHCEKCGRQEFCSDRIK
jgi:hypothetical protein